MSAPAQKPPISRRALPPQPSLEHLRKEAKTRLNWLRAREPSTQLADAQRAVAAGYGFRSWRALKAAIEKQAAEELRACPGFYRHDPARFANIYLEVRMDGGGLTLQGLNGPLVTLQRQDDGRFAAPGLRLRYEFVRDEAGGVIALTVDTDGRQMHLARISQAEADAIAAANRLATAEQRRPRTAVAVPPEQLALHVGHYAAHEMGMAMEILVEDGRLYSQVTGQKRLPLLAESGNDFFLTAVPVQVQFRVENGRTLGVDIHQNGAVTTLSRVSAEEATIISATTAQRSAEQARPRVAVTLSAGLLPRYAGRYRVDADRALTVDVEDGRLFAQITGQGRHEIHAEAEDRFFWTGVAAQVTFLRGSDGLVTHAILHQAGRDMPLPRLREQPP